MSTEELSSPISCAFDPPQKSARLSKPALAIARSKEFQQQFQQSNQEEDDHALENKYDDELFDDDESCQEFSQSCAASILDLESSCAALMVSNNAVENQANEMSNELNSKDYGIPNEKFKSRIPKLTQKSTSSQVVSDTVSKQRDHKNKNETPETTQEENEDAVRSNNKIDRNINFIKRLTESKRKEKEKQEEKEKRKLAYRLKVKKSILQRAMQNRNDTNDKPHYFSGTTAVESKKILKKLNDNNEENTESAEDKQTRILAHKKLLKQQQELLDNLKEKKRIKIEEAEAEKLKEEKRKQNVLKNAIGYKNVSSRLYDIPQSPSAAAGDCSPAAQRKKLANTYCEDMTEEEYRKRKMEEKLKNEQAQVALKEKQQKYLNKIVEKRKEKENLLIEKNKREDRIKMKARESALVNEQEALEKLKEKEAKEKLKDQQDMEAKQPQSKVDVEAMVSRLSKMKETDASLVPEARDYASWKKRNGISENTKVFSITGWYPVIKETLESMGWFHNNDRTSPFFDLKWTLKSDDLKQTKLSEDQYINHFMNNSNITTKDGLLNNLRSLIWFDSVDIDTFFPRAYYLNEPTDMQTFVEDFRAVVAESCLKKVENICTLLVEADTSLNNVVSPNINIGVLEVALSVCRKRQEIIPDSVLDGKQEFGIDPLVTDLEWEVLEKCDLFSRWEVKRELPPIQEPEISNDLSLKEKNSILKLHKKKLKMLKKEREKLTEKLRILQPINKETAELILNTLQGLKEACPQYDLNGSNSKNVWIVKPAGMSRGRGIRVFNNLTQLLNYADVGNHKESQWVAQKYIENPLLLCNRKFDIRQWVLVTSWNPLTVWFYMDCYFRFCIEEFQLDDLDDQYIHLANNSISKNSSKFYQSYQSEEGSIEVEGNMWHSDDFKSYLNKKYGDISIWEEKIQPQMKRIIKWSLQCVQDSIQHRKNSCELYGYDFMIDENHEPWLIEVNSSPACDYSTSVAKRYVQTGLSGIIKIIVNFREYENEKKKGKTGLKKPETGRWEIIHKGDFIANPISSLGVDFHIVGEKFTRKRTCGKNAHSNIIAEEAFKENSCLTAIDEDSHPTNTGRNNNDRNMDLGPQIFSDFEEKDLQDQIETDAEVEITHEELKSTFVHEDIDCLKSNLKSGKPAFTENQVHSKKVRDPDPLL